MDRGSTSEGPAGDVLAGLVGRAVGAGARGGTGGDPLVWRAVVEEASELGARRALARLGLADEAARADLVELRDLLKAWRDAKSEAWRAVLAWGARGLVALVLVALGLRFGIGDLLR